MSECCCILFAFEWAGAPSFSSDIMEFRRVPATCSTAMSPLGKGFMLTLLSRLDDVFHFSCQRSANQFCYDEVGAVTGFGPYLVLGEPKNENRLKQKIEILSGPNHTTNL